MDCFKQLQSQASILRDIKFIHSLSLLAFYSYFIKRNMYYNTLHMSRQTQTLTSMPIKSSGRIVPPGWAPLQPKQSVLSLIV